MDWNTRESIDTKDDAGRRRMLWSVAKPAMSGGAGGAMGGFGDLTDQ